MQLWAFDELLSALSFDEPPAALTSPRYGYSIELTRDWQIAPSTREWTGPGRPTVPCPMPTRTLTRLRASRSPPARSPPKRARTGSSQTPLRCLSTVRLNGPSCDASSATRSLSAGRSRPGRPRSSEAIGLAFVRCAERSTPSSSSGAGATCSRSCRAPGRPATSSASVELVASVRFDDGRTTFVSDAYGYSVRIPGDWQATPASASWAGGRQRRPGARPVHGWRWRSDATVHRHGTSCRCRSMTETDWIGTVRAKYHPDGGDGVPVRVGLSCWLPIPTRHGTLRPSMGGMPWSAPPAGGSTAWSSRMASATGCGSPRRSDGPAQTWPRSTSGPTRSTSMRWRLLRGQREQAGAIRVTDVHLRPLRLHDPHPGRLDRRGRLQALERGGDRGRRTWPTEFSRPDSSAATAHRRRARRSGGRRPAWLDRYVPTPAPLGASGRASRTARTRWEARP